MDDTYQKIIDDCLTKMNNVGGSKAAYKEALEELISDAQTHIDAVGDDDDGGETSEEE